MSPVGKGSAVVQFPERIRVEPPAQSGPGVVTFVTLADNADSREFSKVIAEVTVHLGLAEEFREFAEMKKVGPNLFKLDDGPNGWIYLVNAFRQEPSPEERSLVAFVHDLYGRSQVLEDE